MVEDMVNLGMVRVQATARTLTAMAAVLRPLGEVLATAGWDEATARRLWAQMLVVMLCLVMLPSESPNSNSSKSRLKNPVKTLATATREASRAAASIPLKCLAVTVQL